MAGKYDVGSGLSYMAFSMLRYLPSIPILLRVFIMIGCWILLNAFSASMEMIMWFLSFFLLMWWMMLMDFWMLYYPCICEMNPTWSWCMILLRYFRIRFAHILLSIFASMFIRDIVCNFLFLWCLCLVLILEWCSPHRMSLEVFPSLLLFGKF